MRRASGSTPSVRRRALPRRDVRVRRAARHGRCAGPGRSAGWSRFIGEPYWRRPPPEDYGRADAPYTSLEATITAIESHGLRLVGVIDSSRDDWDRYETLHWRAVEEWLAANGSDPDADDVRSRHEHAKRAYLHHGRELLGWAIFIGWKPLATH